MVSCPGVWLCQNGEVMLRIEMLGILKHTKRVEPTFPLLFHEQFSFRKAFPSIGTLKDLHDELKKRSIHIDLIQWCIGGFKTIVLASFKGSLSDVLYPSLLDKGLMAGVDVDLLMETTKYFPGIIAPKVEISTRVVIEEVTNYQADGYSRLLNRMTVFSKKLSRKTSDSLVLPKTDEEKRTYDNKEIHAQKKSQKPVCHAKQNRCYCSKKSVIKQEEKIKKLENNSINKYKDSECYKVIKYCTCRLCRAIKSKDEINYKKDNITCTFGENEIGKKKEEETDDGVDLRKCSFNKINEIRYDTEEWNHVVVSAVGCEEGSLTQHGTTTRVSMGIHLLYCIIKDKSKECCCNVCRKYEDYFKCFYNKSENPSLDHTNYYPEFFYKTRALSDFSVLLKPEEKDCPCICWRGTPTDQKLHKKKELQTTANESHRYQSSVDTIRLFSYSDLESYYHKLYERVCKNNNSE